MICWMVNDMEKYTDKQNFLIMKKQYPEYDIDYNIGELITVDGVKVGYVSEVIHKPSGEDTYILTDKKLPKNRPHPPFTIPTMDELKNLNPVGYNFIKSLENHENNLVDYINN